MKVEYFTKGCVDLKKMSYPVIVPQAMTNGDGFTLLGFKDWEAVSDEKLSAAVTNVVEFHIDDESVKVGF